MKTHRKTKNKNGPITKKQLAMLKNRFITLMNTHYLPKDFVKWWEKQDKDEMIKKAEKLTIKQASILIYMCVMKNYIKAKSMWLRFT